MNSAKNTVIAVLALVTAGTSVLAWRQYQELIGLRAAAEGANGRAALQKRISDLEKSNRELNEKLAATKSGRLNGAGADGDSPELAAVSPEGPGGPVIRNARGAIFRDVMAKPEIQALMNKQRANQLDVAYAAFFRNLNLSPEQSEKLASLLAERQSALQDVWSAAREQGLNPWTDREGLQKLIADAQAPINDSIKALLGDNGYNQLGQYEQTMPQRNVVNALQQRLSFTDAPLNSSQADQLVQILASNAPQRSNGFPAGMVGGRGGNFMIGMGAGTPGIVGPGSAPITSNAINQAQSVLTPSQVAALQQLQQQQQTAQQLSQEMRNAFQQMNPGGQNPNAAPPKPAMTPSTGGSGHH